jgi:hypothetical protein
MWLHLQAGDKAAADYVALVNLTAQTLQDAAPGATVSVDMPWSPYDVDGRNYDWRGLAAAADTLFIMAYDTASQASCTCREQALLASVKAICTRTHQAVDKQYDMRMHV